MVSKSDAAVRSADAVVSETCSVMFTLCSFSWFSFAYTRHVMTLFSFAYTRRRVDVRALFLFEWVCVEGERDEYPLRGFQRR